MKRILVIEDEPDVAKSIKMLLEDAGYKADIVLGGKEGLKNMSCYDLILLDIIMPKMSGREVLKEMKKRGIDKPVIVVSAVGVPQVVRDEFAILYPGTGFVSKPHMYDDLVKEIKTALARK